MKKIISMFIVTVMAFTALLSNAALSVNAKAVDDDDYYYDCYYMFDGNGDGIAETELEFELDFSSNTANITCVYTDIASVYIPEVLKVTYGYYDYYYDDWGYLDWDYVEKTGNFTVTEISGIDEYNDEITSITIPYTVTKIADKSVGYYYDWWNGYQKISNFKIYCTKSTAAETYAKNNGFSYYAYENIANAKLSLAQNDYNYTGAAIQPDALVTYNSKTLTKDTDYTVAYINNINCGTATAVIKGKGNYRGKKTINFKINAVSAEKATVAAIANQAYTGSAVKPALTVKFNGKTLKQNTDYKVAYSSNTNIGTAYAKITFCGNYTGTKTVSFKIVVGTISSFNSSAVSASSIKLSWTKVKCNQYWLYRYNPTTKNYELYKKLTTNSFTDTGLSQFVRYYYKVKAVVKSGDKYIYSNVASTNCYSKLATPNLSLATKNKSVTLTWTKNAKATGYQIMRSTNGGSYEYIKNIRSNKTVTFTDTGRNNNYAYYYIVRSYRSVGGKVYYGAWSAIKCSKDKIAQLNAATLKPHRTFKVYNKQSTKTTSYNVTLSDNDVKILKNFASKNFTSSMNREQRLRVTLNWINKNVTYATGNNWNQIANKSWVEAIFTYKKGQCAQYNGAMAAMMVYLGYDAYVIQGYRGTWKSNYWQHFWCEVNIGGLKYIMETGNYGKNGNWSYFLTPYSETSGYIVNCKNVGITY